MAANPLTDIIISDYSQMMNQIEYDSKLTDFSVNFIHEIIDRIVVPFPDFNEDYVLYRNPQTINQSTTMVFNPNNNLSISKIEFCLDHCLHLDKDLSQEVIHRLITYVEDNPRPTSLLVCISQVLEYRGSSYEQLLSSSGGMKLESDSGIALLKRIKVEDIKGIKDGEECCCPICLVNFGEKKDVMVTCMPCNHVFHDDCILEWFKRCESFVTCPVCRYELGEKDLA